MTDTEPVPVFRRFPWIQLVFCLACLGMAVCLLLRDLCCRNVTAGELSDDPSLEGRYVEVTGRAHFHGDRWPCDAPASEAAARLDVEVPPDSEDWIWVAVDRERVPPQRSVREFRGRVAYDPFAPGGVVVETHLGRLTGAAVAGLVVGAMGVFIFGLYLRRWLLERKAQGEAATNAGA
ncbi:MAG: hypothetical protein ACYTKD_20285 [Planctomycetota bacterium]